ERATCVNKKYPGQRRIDTCGCPDDGKLYPYTAGDTYTTGLVWFHGQHVVVKRGVKRFTGSGSVTTRRVRVVVRASSRWCGAPHNPWGYNMCVGSLIYSPDSAVCSYFACIASFWRGSGYMAECNDGTFSMSGGISGACS